MRWFRLYTELLDDPKVQRLPGDLFKAWVNLLCLAAKGDGAIPTAADVAFALRISEAETVVVLHDLEVRGLLEPLTDGGCQPHNWATRQFASDNVTTRTRAFRERSRTTSNEAFPRTTGERSGNVPGTAKGTPPEQNRTDTEQNRSRSARARKPPRSRSASPPVRSDLVALVTTLLGKPPNARQTKQLAYHDAQEPRPTDAQYRAAIGRGLSNASGDPIAYAMSFVHDIDPEAGHGHALRRTPANHRSPGGAARTNGRLAQTRDALTDATWANLATEQPAL